MLFSHLVNWCLRDLFLLNPQRLFLWSPCGINQTIHCVKLIMVITGTGRNFNDMNWMGESVAILNRGIKNL